jgi:hypothetical protein
MLQKSGMFLLMLGACSLVTRSDAVCDAPELDLCDAPEVSGAHSRTVPAIALAFAVALQQQYVAPALLLVPIVTAMLPTAAAGNSMTCGELKTFYKNEKCCGSPAKTLSSVPGASPAPAKPKCAMAEPQAPRDLSTGATGKRVPKAATLNDAQGQALPQANVHWHLGAEHKSDAYNDDTDAKAFDAGRRLGGVGKAVRPGFMCPAAGLTADEKKVYTWKHCVGMQVGKTYEVHYVHSSAGYTAADLAGNKDIDLMDDGLGGAALGRGMLNPMVVVEALVFQVVSGGPTINDMVHGWTKAEGAGYTPGSRVMYAGSTTGPSHDNVNCSPYAVTWHVDLGCHKVSPESFDEMCKTMNEKYKMITDRAPHGSRKIVDPKWVVEAKYVTKLA